MAKLKENQMEALKAVRDAGDAGFRNWDGKRHPVDPRTLRWLRAHGFFEFIARGPCDCVYVITDAGRSALE